MPSFDIGEDNFVVNDKMYNIILNGPKSHSNNSNNGYLFGDLYPLNEYKKLLWHQNVHAATGFLDLDLDLFIFRNNDCDDDEITEITSEFNCNDEEDHKLIVELRERFPEILWIGMTEGGDVGARLYVHYDSHNEINSIIVDTGNGYFFNDN